ncbi:ABC transporter ATP-binding protein (plasmid) [Methylocystis sp. MJC1]|jgi:iron complex transport system ATP-binding protein|uniref:ABC transporter ATP-binding protein n=1 Tax=Methylocystis sp. MJC1 TaxID=2654282 RepID=UPI0013EADC9A|nr:ABC transporter ATP-binding protein [Methylocystis sp. MJC1]KAF2989075.1 putative ABC transporter ATP-binding protein [Methylocystis sp. MJC1]MBU6529145.1 ABC transporter ATP-binding protein [Methylocystis sp. MJC1]UZX14075.1 ABC transporter ATP-binding protein [Methylocystis sp. MJC1]
MNAVVFEHISFRRPAVEREALADVSFSVGRGEILCVLGPNGAGKTTLIKCLLGDISPTRGRIRVLGDDATQLSHTARAKLISYVPQSSDVMFPFEARHMVLLGRIPHVSGLGGPTRADWEIADTMLSRVGVSHLARRSINHLSGGERQLVLIARALAQDAPILVMDEPTSSLDLANQGRVLALTRELAQSGKTVLMTTHAPDHPFLLGAKVALLKNGRLLGVGAAKDVCSLDAMGAAYEADLLELTHASIKSFAPRLP